MDLFFCSEASRHLGEDLIGSVIPCQTYILIECPLPWKANAFESKPIPQNLRDLVKSVKESGLPIRFLLINQSKSQERDCTQVLIYEKQPGIFSQGYRRGEWNVTQIEEVAPLIKRYLAGELPVNQALNSAVRDILVCIHGSHDKCCAKYGLPFYREGLATIAQLGYDRVQLWQTSHFGGHRFAPTLIDLPDGRYYGRLNQTAFQTILTRLGDPQCLNLVYRGWSILPQSLQPLEQELIGRYGWEWFNFKIAHHIVAQSLNGDWIQAEISVQHPDGFIHRYEAEMVKDLRKTVYLSTSCGDSMASEQVKYMVKSLRRILTKTLCLSC
jgi:hypothetical protein